MPLYEFVCDCCGLEKEIRLSIGETLVCPTCNVDMKKKVSKIGHFDLQGGGWAKEGYCSNKNEG